ncbi:hypothetical protein [Nocardioides sp. GY 10127]|uniref:hypothetical protein n=1 Tax=Nocardioides sp. GY 10127 TaxID=2569762 RepID=UPI0010A8FB66|nr:hypothetical protein [Nocardioides sp. GY 10127]TIC84202.1 hypothetical protein E8D37_05270 [Nocardioides sp. GY 10127]
MAKRVFLHVGTMKSGTTFLQSLMWKHRAALLERGLLLPGERLLRHFHSSALVCGRQEVIDELTPAELGTWERLLEQVREFDGDGFIGHELFSPATPEQAAGALADLEKVADEVHVVLTMRDLGRQLPSHWQEVVKSGTTATLAEYAAAIEADPDEKFWTFHDAPRLLARWTQGLPAERVHVVVVPKKAPSDWLWREFLGLMGVSSEGLDHVSDNPNTSLDMGGAEVMRRVQLAIPADEHGLTMRRLTKGFLTRDVLGPAGSRTPFVIGPDAHAFLVRRAAEMTEELRSRGYDVVGDLDDLLVDPTPPAGRTADDVTEDEVASVAVGGLARMVVHDRHQRDEIATLLAQRARLRGRVEALERQLAQASAPAQRRPLHRRLRSAVGRRLRRG